MNLFYKPTFRLLSDYLLPRVYPDTSCIGKGLTGVATLARALAATAAAVDIQHRVAGAGAVQMALSEQAQEDHRLRRARDEAQMTIDAYSSVFESSTDFGMRKLCQDIEHHGDSPVCIAERGSRQMYTEGADKER